LPARPGSRIIEVAVRKFISVASESFPIQVLMTLVTYSLYAALIGTCLLPSALLLHAAAQALLVTPPLSMALVVRLLLFCLCVGASLYVYFITGILLMGSFVRLLSLGMRPGRYPISSATTLRWMIYSGISGITQKTILPMIPVTFFSSLYFRLVGCRMGKRVRLNSWLLHDAWLIELGDDVVIGGGTDISPHQFEDNHLILEPIRIGSGTLLGAHCYVSPGVTIGKECLIGIRSFLRRGTTVPDGTRTTSLAGLPLRDMYRIEKAGRTKR
jgi:hypothetical protein